MNSLSSPESEERLQRLALGRLHEHPRNANLMSDERKQKLRRNIEREGRYPPLIVRPHPEIDGDYQLIDGHQRKGVLQGLGHEDALCYVWPCDDATALVLLATLNRLEGEDVPAKRAELLEALTALLSPEELALLLPEDGAAIKETLGLLSLDSAALLAELEGAFERESSSGPRVITFAVLPEDEAVVEKAVASAATELTGANRRGRALGLICRAYLDGVDG